MKSRMSINEKSMDKTKIIIYQATLLDRIIYILSGVGLFGFFIMFLTTKTDNYLIWIILLVIDFIYCMYSYLILFKTFICLDIKNNKLIIRESPGIRKKEYDLNELLDINISDSKNVKNYFTINFNFKSFTIKIKSWSTAFEKHLFFSRNIKQKKRLIIFINECNNYLKNR